MKQIVAVLPVFNPTEVFEEDLKQFYQLQFAQMIIVNDGSDAKYAPLFEKLQKIPNIIVLTHEKKLGKGAAVKTACAYILRFLKRCQGVLFIGAYGQHKLEDVEKMLHLIRVYTDGIVLGVRNFQSSGLPPFSRISNMFVTLLFELKCKKRITDVQTALRYVPMQQLWWIPHIDGEHFEVDVYMLMEAVKHRIPIYQIQIGRATFKKNTFIQYDEAFRFRHISKKILRYRYVER